MACGEYVRLAEAMCSASGAMMEFADLAKPLFAEDKNRLSERQIQKTLRLRKKR
jgi:hypothetical protein